MRKASLSALLCLALVACEDAIEPQEATPPARFARVPVAAGIETQITTDPSRKFRVAISGDRIVWDDLRNGNGDIFMFDLATGAETQITTDPSGQFSPAISGDRIVWVDRRNTSQSGLNFDIYMFELAAGIVPEVRAIADAVNGFLADGSIDSAGIAEGLFALLAQAEAHILRGNNTAATNSLNSFISQIEGKTPQHITTSAAQTLISMAQAVIDRF